MHRKLVEGISPFNSRNVAMPFKSALFVAAAFSFIYCAQAIATAQRRDATETASYDFVVVGGLSNADDPIANDLHC